MEGGGSCYKDGRWKVPKKSFLVKNFIIQDSGKNTYMMGRRHPDGHITDPRNKRMEETSRRQRRTEASSEGCQGPEGAVAP